MMMVTVSFDEEQEFLDLGQGLDRLQDRQSTLSQECVHTGVTLREEYINMSRRSKQPCV